jgi:hypothetical protein
VGGGNTTDAFRKVSWAAVGVSILVALLIGPLAAPARATFSAAVKLAAPVAAGAKVALDAQGNVIAVWSHYDGKKWRVQERPISAAGSVGRVRTISAAGDKPLWPQIAANPKGGAIVVWSRTRNLAGQPRGRDSRVEARTISANGQLGSVKAVSTKGRRAGGPRIASDARGNAIVAWQQKQATLRIKVRRISAKGALGHVQTLSSAKRKSEGLAIASSSRGKAIVAWSQTDGKNWRIRARQISASGRLGSVKTISAPGHDAGLTEVASDARGNATVVWSQFGANDSGRSIKAQRVSATGTVRRGLTLSPARDEGLQAQVASDARGDTIVVWDGDGAKARQISPTGIPGPTQTLSSPGQPGYSPQVAINGNGTATALWYDADFTVHPDRWDLQTRQISAPGALGPTQTLATKPIRNTAIAVNPEGDAFAGWSQFDGSQWSAWGSQGP